MKLPPFQALLDEYREDIYRFLLASVGANDADDCFQDTFLAAFDGYPRLTDSGNLRGWLFTIAHHKAVDCHRLRRRASPAATAFDLAVAPTVPADEALWSRVQGLPPKQRSAVTLRYVGDLTYRTIGRVIGCSEAAARQNVRAGLEALRKDIDHE